MKISTRLLERFGSEACDFVERKVSNGDMCPWPYSQSNFFTGRHEVSEYSSEVKIVGDIISILESVAPIIVSLGCGVRDGFAFAFERHGYAPIFTDYYEAPLLLLKAEIVTRKTALVDAKNMPFRDESVDVFTEDWFFSEPSLCIQDHRIIAEEIRRTLKMGGFLLASEHLMGICKDFRHPDNAVVDILIGTYGFTECADRILQKPQR
jgi:hypothetical protein